VTGASSWYPDTPEPLIVDLARGGDRGAFEELVRRRQGEVRGLMRHLSNDAALADDLAQQVFLQAWLRLRTLRKVVAFSGWLKRIAVNTWLQHVRRNDALEKAQELPESTTAPPGSSPAMGLDLDRALATLSGPQRLCLVLSYHEGMSHGEIAEATRMPLGTVKSNVQRGAKQLRAVLAAYRDTALKGTES
jgi:RNA polymerase sigma-70 factor (ECF subfamily)